MRRALAYWAVAALAFASAFSQVDDAHACGGFFCDSPGSGQPPMPVDQTGETIVFAFDGENVEAHIQIQYTGDPERFAWLIPLQNEPEITVGSAQLFLNLLNSTVPAVNLGQTFEGCTGPSEHSDVFGCAVGGSEDDSAVFGGSGAAPGRNGGAGTGPTVLRRSVGAFEVSILSGSAAAVEQWLVANNFLPDQEAPAIVDEYASRGYVFAAIKLAAGADLKELHPLVVKYRGSEPCVPLKLTAIAAQEDMAVRAFFLGQRRAVPIGAYRHVSLNFGAPRLAQFRRQLHGAGVECRGFPGRRRARVRDRIRGPELDRAQWTARSAMERERFPHASVRIRWSPSFRVRASWPAPRSPSARRRIHRSFHSCASTFQRRAGSPSRTSGRMCRVSPIASTRNRTMARPSRATSKSESSNRPNTPKRCSRGRATSPGCSPRFHLTR